MDDGCSTCSVVGLCPRCSEIVCWGHHRNVEAMIDLPIERLREDLRQRPPQEHFADRCTRELV